jgi:hypothetical protein
VIGHAELVLINRYHRHVRLARLLIGPPELRSQGYGRAMVRALLDVAFRELEVRRVELEVYAANVGAQRVYESLGFEREGVRRAAVRCGDEWWDSILMARISDDSRRIGLPVDRAPDRRHHARRQIHSNVSVASHPASCEWRAIRASAISAFPSAIGSRRLRHDLGSIDRRVTTRVEHASVPAPGAGPAFERARSCDSGAQTNSTSVAIGRRCRLIGTVSASFPLGGTSGWTRIVPHRGGASGRP